MLQFTKTYKLMPAENSMPQYLAKYNVVASQYDGGYIAGKFSEHTEARFEASDDKKAIALAQEHIPELNKKYLEPEITLEELLEIRPVSLV